MDEYNSADYSFLGLCHDGMPLPSVCSLVYVVGLVGSANNEMCDLKTAGRFLQTLFDFEEQTDAAFMLIWQKDYLPADYYPQTPCMLTKEWSPISAMLDQGFCPLILRRDSGAMAVATGVWDAFTFQSTVNVIDAETFDQLFWAILSESFRRAKERNKLVSIIAQPGWSYGCGDALTEWSEEDIKLSDRILWRRRPAD